MQENEGGSIDIGFYFITDRRLSVNGIFEDVREALEAGVKIIQYREKQLPTRKMYEEGIEIGKLCRKYGARYIVNDRIDIAMATDADGVHIGQEDMPLEIARNLMPDAIIGVSCSNLEEAIKAERGGADYLGVGPIYRTSTKEDAGAPTGIEILGEIKRNVNIPIVAIGGITLENVRKLIEAGADSVSAISAVIGEKTGENVAKFVKEMEKWRMRYDTDARCKEGNNHG